MAVTGSKQNQAHKNYVKHAREVDQCTFQPKISRSSTQKEKEDDSPIYERLYLNVNRKPKREASKASQASSGGSESDYGTSERFSFKPKINRVPESTYVKQPITG